VLARKYRRLVDNRVGGSTAPLGPAWSWARSTGNMRARLFRQEMGTETPRWRNLARRWPGAPFLRRSGTAADLGGRLHSACRGAGQRRLPIVSDRRAVPDQSVGGAAGDPWAMSPPYSEIARNNWHGPKRVRAVHSGGAHPIKHLADPLPPAPLRKSGGLGRLSLGDWPVKRCHACV